MYSIPDGAYLVCLCAAVVVVFSPVLARMAFFRRLAVATVSTAGVSPRLRWTSALLAAPLASARSAANCGGRAHPGASAFGIAPPEEVSAAAAAALHAAAHGDDAAAAATAAPPQLRRSLDRGAARAGAPPRRSGVQREVLSLYRALLQRARRLTDLRTQQRLSAHIRGEFRRHSAIPRKNVALIEWHMQHGKRKLDDLLALKLNSRFSIVAVSPPHLDSGDEQHPGP